MIGLFRNARIGRKMTFLAVAAGAISLVFAAIALLLYAYQHELDSAQSDLQSIARLMAANTTAALSFNDAATATETLSTLRAKDQVTRACLWTLTDGKAMELFAAYERSSSDPTNPDQRSCRSIAPVAGTLHTGNTMTTGVWVELLDERIGLLSVVESLDPLRERLSTQIQITIIILLGSLLATLPLVRMIQRLITEPILNLADVASRVSSTSDYALRAEHHGEDEIGQLAKIFNEMLARTEDSNQAIEDARDRLAAQVEETQVANTELARAMEQLKETQEQLVQTEKFASLGGLVAGVAHEINTPVGVGVTAASTLEMHARDLQSKYDSGELKKSELQAFIELATESSSIILSNLRRAGDLVQSFKQVAVDQSSSERRDFDLKIYIDEILTSLTPRLKRSIHRVECDVPAGIVLQSYPGALAQVLTNLIDNALLHAFDDESPGLIQILVSPEDDKIRLEFSDDGGGMPEDHVRRIFDPFFTTKRGSGGSGLGMQIVFNLVTQVLGGSIKVNSAPGQGTRYMIEIARIARDADNDG